MKPTFSLSAAEAALMLPASKSPVVSARSVFLIVYLHTVGERHTPRHARPIAHAADIDSMVGHAHGAERGRRGRAAGARARQQSQDDHSREIGQRRHELRRNADAPAL